MKKTIILTLIISGFFIFESTAQEGLNRKYKKVFNKAERMQNKNYPPKKTIAVYETILTQYPNHPETLHNIAELYYLKLNDPKSAFDYYAKAVEGYRSRIKTSKKSKVIKYNDKALKYCSKKRDVCKNKIK